MSFDPDRDEDFLTLMDNAILYRDTYGSVFLHPIDLERYLTLLPANRFNREDPNIGPSAYVWPSWGSLWKRSRDLWSSTHTSQGMARFGYSLSSKKSTEVYRPRGEILTSQEACVRLLEAIQKSDYEWDDVRVAQQELHLLCKHAKGFKSIENARDINLRGSLGEHSVYLMSTVVPGTVVTGYSTSQVTHHVYQWTSRILSESERPDGVVVPPAWGLLLKDWL
jgi:hypothetical protein